MLKDQKNQKDKFEMNADDTDLEATLFNTVFKT